MTTNSLTPEDIMEGRELYRIYTATMATLNRIHLEEWLRSHAADLLCAAERLDLAQSQVAAYRDTMKTVVAKREELIADLAVAAERLAEVERQLAEADSTADEALRLLLDAGLGSLSLHDRLYTQRTRHASRRPKEPEHE